LRFLGSPNRITIVGFLVKKCARDLVFIFNKRSKIEWIMKKSKAVFLDRDGTIIYDVNYPKYPSQVRVLPGTISALKSFSEIGYKLIIISNQSGIGRGIITFDEVERVNQRVFSIFKENNVFIDAIYYCPHAPDDQCDCRKPSPKMILRAAKDMEIDLTRSFMIGDKSSDIEAGKRASCKTILISENTSIFKINPIPDLIANKWSDVLSYILNESLKPH